MSLSGFQRFGIAFITAIATYALAAHLGTGDHEPRGTGPSPVHEAEIERDGDTIRISPRLLDQWDIETASVRSVPRPPIILHGMLFFENERLSNVRSRFVGEVSEVGTSSFVPGDTSDSYPRSAALRVGDRVEKGQLLCVILSHELGEKKSELVDALVRLKTDEETLKRVRRLYAKEAIPDRQLRESERAVEMGRIAVQRVERTLNTWGLSAQEIQAAREEAAAFQVGKRTLLDIDRWARVEVRARGDGIILEKNFTLGDRVDRGADLFKLADLSRLAIHADAYDEDVRYLEDLPPSQRRWSIRLKSRPHDPPVEGTILHVGKTIDPVEHTAVVSGWVENPDDVMRVGQFVTATIDLPPAAEQLVLVPRAAVLDGEKTSYVFVQCAKDSLRFQRRPVLVQSISGGLAQIAITSGGNSRLRRGEMVVVSGNDRLARQFAATN